MPQHPDEPVVETTTEARSGETGHNVRYVLLFGLGGVRKEAIVYRVKGYSTGQSPETRRFEVPSLDNALAKAARLKAQGFYVEIRDEDGKVVSQDPIE